MSLTTSKPLRLAGACLNSGNIDTGQEIYSQGGGQVFTAFSGVGVDTLIQSGPGRLDTILLTTPLVSGTATVFYDSAVATSGGPFSNSGHKIVGILPAAINKIIGVVSGTAFGGLVWTGEPYHPAMPFFSGLCAAPTGNTTANSGSHSWSISYTTAAVVSGTPVGGP